MDYFIKHRADLRNGPRGIGHGAGQYFQEEDALRRVRLSLAYRQMRRFLAHAVLLTLISGGLVSCATSEISDSSGSTGPKSSVPGADDSDRAGSLAPAVGTNGAGAGVRF